MNTLMKRIFTLAMLAVAVVLTAVAQSSPVNFKSSMKATGPKTAEIVFTGTIAPGWHVYAPRLGQDGPIEASFHVDKADGVKPVGQLEARGKQIEEDDPIFGMRLRYFEHNVTFVQRVEFTKPKYSMEVYLEYGACNESMCMPPTAVEFKHSGTAEVSDAEAKEAAKDEPAEAPAEEAAAPAAADSTVAAPAPVANVASSDSAAWWKPVIAELKAFDDTAAASDLSWIYIFLQGILGGLIALFTPCVWPIIPMTVSFFLHRNHNDRRKAVGEALMYGASIVVIYVLLGLVVTTLFGASALNALSTNAVFNIFFCLLLVVFAASFFGAFEIQLPSSWGNKIDMKASSTSGLLSIFLMAFTLSLVSFSCTGPIIGFLLVAVSSTGDIIAPTIGMLGFAIALAIPFALFAMFPSWLKQMPKSGGWMNAVKVSLAFVELAFALKFLSVADLAYGWHILDRETFLALWIAIFGLLSMYLLGRLKLSHDDPDQRIGVPRLMLGLCSLAFTIYMIPGLWGAPLKAVSAFSPPINTQDFNLQPAKVEARFTNYEEGMAAAAREGKPVLVDFTGFGCVNCRKMEGAVWNDPRVVDWMNNKYVLISLFVDDKTPLAEHIKVNVNGTERTLRTVGDKWSYLQQVKFGAVSQPFYVLVDEKGQTLGGSYAYDENIDKYLNFLKSGYDRYKSKK